MVLRVFLVLGWFLVAGAALAYHFGPGQEQSKLALAAARAAAAVAEVDPRAAVEDYDAALAALPAGRTAEARSLRVAKAKAMMLGGQLPEANAELQTLVDELAADSGADPKLLGEARDALANSQYYVTWLMRLEGEGPAAWEPEIEAARQTYKLLAEQAEARGDAAGAARHREDLEAAVRLARMDLGELQAKNLPKQCKGCCSCKSKRPGNKPSGQKREDARGASGAQPLDEGGH